MLSLTFLNHRLVLFLNRDAVSDLINVALAVPLTCHITNDLDFFFFLLSFYFFFFSPQSKSVFDFHVCAENVLILNSSNSAVSNVGGGGEGGCWGLVFLLF